MHTILGLGSNSGDRLSFLRKAVQKLRSCHPSFEILAISPIYESDALLPTGAPESWNQSFLNFNLLCNTSLEAEALLPILKRIELEIGRQNRGRWAPREIDLDILAMESRVIQTPHLEVPHPGLMERPFAFLPFADLAPNWRFPVTGPYFGTSISDHVLQWRKGSATRSQKTLTEFVGILNITPDSFSDGGQHQSAQSVLDTVHQWVENGIRILDLGAESTRPNAVSITTEAEILRLEPIFSALMGDQKLKSESLLISVDTRHPEVAEWAIQHGAHWINDVSGLRNLTMRDVIAKSTVDAVFMHSTTVPVEKDSVIPEDTDPTSFLLDWGYQQIQELGQAGISRERLIFDPGIGFGKTPSQSWSILRNARKFQELGVRTFFGHSRKSFLSTLTRLPFSQRDAETSAISIDLFEKGIDFIRVHDPIHNSRATQAWNFANGVIRCKI